MFNSFFPLNVRNSNFKVQIGTIENDVFLPTLLINMDKGNKIQNQYRICMRDSLLQLYLKIGLLLL